MLGMNGVNECYACNCKLSYLQCVKLCKCKSFTSQIVLHVDNNKKIVLRHVNVNIIYP